ncbi:MAG: hypothetical protein KatS3mg115_0523 [Candidatus Poribacteria bacterium]|nr:MAG: hypothetical protein KatS3mg115_0523 [Candidatus Poribacteria bacterium]
MGFIALLGRFVRRRGGAVGLLCWTGLWWGLGGSGWSQELPGAAPEEVPSESVVEASPQEEPPAQTDSEVRILRPDMPLEPDQVYVSGAFVEWNDQLAHVGSDETERAYLRYQNISLYADSLWTDMRELLRAEGNVRLVVGQEETFAEELLLNLKTKKGLAKGGAAYGAPWYYQGYEIYRVSESESLIENGRLSTSSLKYPHSYFRASKILVRLDQEIIAKHVVFTVGGVPLLYLPVYRRNLKKDKPATIILKLGSDSFQGTWASLILPLTRRDRIRSVLQFDYATLRGTGQAWQTTYRVRDVHLREIVFQIPQEATPEERSALRRKATEINRRLRGDFNRVHVRRLFVPFQITQEDRERARSLALEVLGKLQSGEASFEELARQYSFHESRNQGGELGYLAPGDGVLSPDLEAIALSLNYDQVSPLIERPDGFYLFRVADVLSQYGRTEKLIQMIWIAVEASAASQEQTQERVARLVEEARAGRDFLEIVQEHGAPLPRSAWLESERRAGLSEAPVELWAPKNEFTDFAQRRFLDRAQPGAVSDPFELREGLLVLQYLEEEPTPDFATLARELSDAESAERGGDIGYVGQRDVPRNVFNAAVGLRRGEVSRLIETDEAFYVVQNLGRRALQGEATFLRKDLYSYGREDTFRIGEEWDAIVRHQQDIPTPWEVKGRRIAFWSRLDYLRRAYKEPIFGRDQSTLRLFGVLTFDSNPTTPEDLTPSFRSRLTVDKTYQFIEGDTGTVQRLPELTFSWGGRPEPGVRIPPTQPTPGPDRALSGEMGDSLSPISNAGGDQLLSGREPGPSVSGSAPLLQRYLGGAAQARPPGRSGGERAPLHGGLEPFADQDPNAQPHPDS